MLGKDVLNGSFGRLMMNGKEIAEIKDFTAKVIIVREDIPINGTISVQTKIRSKKGVGSFTINKVYDRFIEEKLAILSDNDKSFSLSVATEDPDHGGERTEYLLPICYFTGELPIMNWCSSECVTEKYNFVFNDKDLIKVHSREEK